MIAVCMTVSMQGCRSDEPDQPGPAVVKECILYEKDSVATRHILEAYGAKFDKDNEDWCIDSISHWNIKMAYDSTVGKKRVIALYLKGDDERPGEAYIPECISDLEYLAEFEVSGLNYGGELPESMLKLKYLHNIYIEGTNITRIPDELFTINTRIAWVVRNPNLSSLPSSVERLVSYSVGEEILCDPAHPFYGWNIGFFRFSFNNKLTGKPIFAKSGHVGYDSCSFNEVDWETIGKIYKSSDCYGTPLKPGAFSVWDNNLSGEIPDEVKSDTIRMWRVRDIIGRQKKGYGYEWPEWMPKFRTPSVDKSKNLRALPIVSMPGKVDRYTTIEEIRRSIITVSHEEAVTEPIYIPD